MLVPLGGLSNGIGDAASGGNGGLTSGGSQACSAPVTGGGGGSGCNTLNTTGTPLGNSYRFTTSLGLPTWMASPEYNGWEFYRDIFYAISGGGGVGRNGVADNGGNGATGCGGGGGGGGTTGGNGGRGGDGYVLLVSW